MFIARPLHRNHSFVAKSGAAAILVVLGDWLTYSEVFIGPALGLFALGWALLTIATNAALRRDLRAVAAGSVALLLAVVLIDDPSLLACSLFGVALTMAALLPRTAHFDDAWRWSQRSLLAALTAAVGPACDAMRLRRQGRAVERRPLTRFVPLLALPVLGAAVFVALFAAANPLIGNALDAVRLPVFDIDELLTRMLLWGFVLTLVWTTLRPRRIRLRDHVSRRTTAIPGVSVASVTLSLLVFNALFAVENVLDIAFLWSGAELPGDMKMKDYVHRGAYPLIVTALLAGLFVIVTLRPGSETASQPLIRRLVLLWTAQNILLVASSVVRTLDYIDAYQLTVLRIAALAWMTLVATGLALICWRVLRHKSAAWLINRNAAAALVVLLAASTVDLGAVAAAWNIRHAREVGGNGQTLDLCYLESLGSSALVPLTELALRTPASEFGDRVRWVRENVLHATAETQAGRYWTGRNARRLAVAERTGELRPRPAPSGFERTCLRLRPLAALPPSAEFVPPLTFAPPQ